MQAKIYVVLAFIFFTFVPVAHSDSLWEHNGSQMRFIEVGGNVEIRYEQPTELMERAGAKSGTVLFDGDRYGEFYHGTARRFSKYCKTPLEYRVSGHRVGERRIVLWGFLKTRNPDCEPAGVVKTDQMVFDLVAAEDTSKRSASYKLDDEADKKMAENVIACFTSGVAGDRTMSFDQMRNCSGVWVTRKALLSCVLASGCPVIEDSSTGRATFDAMLKAEDLTRTQPLTLDPQKLPLLPDKTVIENCQATSGNSDEFGRCLVQNTANSRYNAIRDCFKNDSEAADLNCFAQQIDNANLTVLIGCIGKGIPTAAKVLDCTLNQEVKARATKLKECIDAASTDEATSCLTKQLPQEQQQVAECLTGDLSNQQVAECLARLSPDTAKAQKLTNCLYEGNSVQCATEMLPPELRNVAECIAADDAVSSWTACATQVIGTGDQAEVAECLTTETTELGAFACVAQKSGNDPSGIGRCILQSDTSATAACFLGDKPEVKAFQDFYRCARNGSDPAYLVENCTEGLFDTKTSQGLACALRAKSDKGALATCVAGAALPPDAARLVGCATSSQGATDFALCAAAPGMNEEWRIAAECAVQSGGEPFSFAGCTAGRLTVRELTKCFTGKIGEDCFGKNNTIIVFYRNAFNDITQGPGKNNEVVKALDALDDLTGGENSVINKPEQILGGPNSLVRNPGQIWGGDSSVFNQVAGGKNSEVRKVLRAMDPSSWF